MLHRRLRRRQHEDSIWFKIRSLEICRVNWLFIAHSQCLDLSHYRGGSCRFAIRLRSTMPWDTNHFIGRFIYWKMTFCLFEELWEQKTWIWNLYNKKTGYRLYPLPLSCACSHQLLHIFPTNRFHHKTYHPLLYCILIKIDAKRRPALYDTHYT